MQALLLVACQSTPTHKTMANPSDFESQYKLAKFNAAVGNTDVAIDQYQKILATNSEPQYDLMGELGELYYKNGNPAKADQYLTLAVNNNVSQKSRYQLLLADVALQVGNDAIMTERFNDALAEPKSKIDALNLLGTELDRSGQHFAAKQCFATILKENNHSIAAKNNYALSMALQGQFTNAIALLKQLPQDDATVKSNLQLLNDILTESNLTSVGTPLPVVVDPKLSQQLFQVLYPKSAVVSPQMANSLLKLSSKNC